ncbi:MAG: Hsp20/alpha crystallin family protein [Acidobacteriota bacterium]|nr:Hsp20/alpha crystallin family protein [Acidobacteriota bacterium]MDH3529132.1 Hsp20/alpha crystallin family protein [Acidobacteriota bacterium]
MSNAVPKMISSSVRLENLELQRMKERTVRLFAALEEALEADSPDSFDSFSPAIDICESKSCVRIYVELPGVEPEKIDLTISAKEVVIEGDKLHSINPEKALSHYCCERSYGRFRRRIQLRWAVNINNTTASLSNGTLEIVLSKLEDRRGKAVRIPIAVEE